MGSLVASLDIQGSLCVLGGPGDRNELPSWTYTAPRPSRHLSHRTGDMAVHMA